MWTTYWPYSTYVHVLFCTYLQIKNTFSWSGTEVPTLYPMWVSSGYLCDSCLGPKSISLCQNRDCRGFEMFLLLLQYNSLCIMICEFCLWCVVLLIHWISAELNFAPTLDWDLTVVRHGCDEAKYMKDIVHLVVLQYILCLGIAWRSNQRLILFRFRCGVSETTYFCRNWARREGCKFTWLVGAGTCYKIAPIVFHCVLVMEDESDSNSDN